jgi:hypothetical protein
MTAKNKQRNGRGIALAATSAILFATQNLGAACNSRSAHWSNAVSQCTDCSTGKRINDGGICNYQYEINGAKIFCDCMPEKHCLEGAGEMVNVIIQHRSGVCSGGICVSSGDYRTTYEIRRMALTQECNS